MTDLSVAEWRKSTFCSNSSCVEVAFIDTSVALRDSKNQDGPVLIFSKAEWTAFINGARNGEFCLRS
jgi:hypothetical protein